MADTPQIIGDPDSHRTIRSVLSSRAPTKVLDLPCGQGMLSAFLREEGWDVHCADIDAGNMRVEGFPFTIANLNRRLPFDDGSFPVVLCVNGLHRCFNYGGAIQEFWRVLAPGGVLYINVNNYASVDRRMRFFLYGSIADAVNVGAMQQTIEDPEAHVRIPLLFPQMANALRDTGFELLNVYPVARRARRRWLTPLSWGIRLATHLVNTSRRERDWLDVTNSNSILSGGSYLLIEARKPPEAG